MNYKIKLEPQAVEDLLKIKEFITVNDSAKKADNFLNLLKENIQTIKFMPFKHRKSYFHEDEKIRDLIFKGYTIVFKIHADYISVITIFRQKNY